MSAPKIQRITVESKESLESAITQYVAQGFLLAHKTDSRATLQKPKKFNVAIGIVGFLFCILGLVIYLIVYSTQPDAEVIEISVG